ncbi:MAG: hypothetical protein AAGC67_00520 [Myxococcota bacterium]
MAATPVSSSISLESFAQVCTGPGTCGVLVDQETALGSDTQLATLGDLSATADANAASGTGPNANATINMTTQFSSASSGTTSFSGGLNVSDPGADFTHACQANNDRSDGFSYTFVSSAEGCSPSTTRWPAVRSAVRSARAASSSD